MKTIPSVNALGNALSFLEYGYDFIHYKRKELDSNVIAIKLLSTEIICLAGEEGAKLFYDTEKFQRTGAVPKRIQKTLTGEGAVHTLDDEKHRQRKGLFLAATTEEHLARFVKIMNQEWERAVVSWEQKGKVTLFAEAQQIITRAVCKWADVPLAEADVEQKAQSFIAMVDAFGAVGPRHWRGKSARESTEEWIINVIEQLRSGKLTAAPGTALSVVDRYQEDGVQLDSHMAAVELINLLRPAVAVAYFVVFAALAIHDYPECKLKMQDNPEYAEWFTLELRRFYPLAPVMGAIAKDDFEWQGFEFKKGTLVLLDIYGINHDEQLWEQPEKFMPERFGKWNGSAFNYVPHGGGYPQNGHRCPGERMTIETLKIAADFLINRLEYDVTPQDLTYSMNRMPTYPKSGFIMKNIKLKNDIARS